MNIRNILLIIVFFAGCIAYAQKKIVVLHTNDSHSRIEALPETDMRNPGLGGVVARASIIDSIRQVDKNVLLFDVGDFVQGTPYFNLFHGRVEAQAISIMKYDAITIGNHEFDYGLDTLKMIIDKTHAPFVCSNYDFSETVIGNTIKPYLILKKDNVKIGIIGLGANPEGLVQKDKYEGMKYYLPVVSANNYAKKLKEKEKCDLIICLSHCGYHNDVKLAQETRYIDLILGGHSHTFMQKPELYKNLDGKNVMIFQNGKDAAYLGVVEIELDKLKK